MLQNLVKDRFTLSLIFMIFKSQSYLLSTLPSLQKKSFPVISHKATTPCLISAALLFTFCNFIVSFLKYRDQNSSQSSRSECTEILSRAKMELCLILVTIINMPNISFGCRQKGNKCKFQGLVPNLKLQIWVLRSASCRHGLDSFL